MSDLPIISKGLPNRACTGPRAMDYGIFLVLVLKKKVMKKIIAGLSVVILSVCAMSASAQNGGGGADRMAQYRQMLKDSVQLNDTQIDSVMAVRQDMRPQMMAIRQDQSMSQEDKQAKMKALNDAASARYAKFMSADQAAKLQAMQDRMMARMRNRQGGGGGGGNR